MTNTSNPLLLVIAFTITETGCQYDVSKGAKLPSTNSVRKYSQKEMHIEEHSFMSLPALASLSFLGLWFRSLHLPPQLS